jgi:uncharacterized protein (DUF58 family)
VVAGLAGLAWVTGDVWLLLLASFAVGALVVDACLPLPGACLHVALEGPPRARVGDRVELEVTFANAGTRTSRACSLSLHCAQLEVEPVQVGALAAGERVRLRVGAQVVGRGSTETLQVDLLKFGILGLLTWSGAGSCTLGLLAGPAPAPAWTLPELSGPSPGGTLVLHPGGAEIHAVRDWRPGDPSRHVHWRSSARRGRLVVTDRLEELGGDLVLVVAAPVSSGGLPDPTWEELIARLAATSAVSLGQGRGVHLVSAIAGVPDLHTHGHPAVLDWCARLPGPEAVAGDERAALERAVRIAGAAGGELVVRTPAAQARAAAR